MLGRSQYHRRINEIKIPKSMKLFCLLRNKNSIPVRKYDLNIKEESACVAHLSSSQIFLNVSHFFLLDKDFSCTDWYFSTCDVI